MNPRDWFLVAEAWAAGGGEHHAPDISGIIFPLLNFLIYAGIIYYFAFPLIRSFLKARHDEVLATVTEAAARKRKANEIKRAYLKKPKSSLQRLKVMLSFLPTRRSRLPSSKCF
jgi:F0F1-type ATP synthase membrane subunit b/b'